MLKKEILELIKNIDDEGSVDEVLSQNELGKSLIQSGLTLDAFKGKMKDKDFKAFMDSEKDKYFQKALETWKTNNLEKEFEPWIQEKYPDLVTDPTQKKLLELEKELEKERKANAKKDLLTEAIKYANEKKIPSSLVEKFLDEDLEKTKANLDGFIESINPWIQEQVDTRLGQSSWTPGSSGNGATKSIGEQIAEEQNNATKVEGPNPWA
ncbi:DUF4355 domain-containing protein [Clostridium sp. Ade.TY]|uniref:DUF4355 domain-containing protein n=1 Tax=Clostridium sp. Ade.TY TaxID=1391647 RepID=UPI0004127CBC|nr:DUF4355 domain-containing protein [Clostridium sp. Ade.TY]